MDTKTLDEKLRERGAKKLAEQLDRAFSGALELHYVGRDAPTRLKDPQHPDWSLDVERVLKMAKDAAYQAMKPRAEQLEVDEFMEQIERMGQEIDALKDELQQ